MTRVPAEAWTLSAWTVPDREADGPEAMHLGTTPCLSSVPGKNCPQTATPPPLVLTAVKKKTGCYFRYPDAFRVGRDGLERVSVEQHEW